MTVGKDKPVTAEQMEHLVEIIAALNDNIRLLNLGVFGENPAAEDDELGQIGYKIGETSKKLSVIIDRTQKLFSNSDAPNG